MPSRKKSKEICPNCGSTNWKEVAKAGGYAGFEDKCLECGYQGTFFVGDMPVHTKKKPGKMSVRPAQPNMWITVLAVVLILLVLLALRFGLWNQVGTSIQDMMRYVVP